MVHLFQQRLFFLIPSNPFHSSVFLLYSIVKILWWFIIFHSGILIFYCILLYDVGRTSWYHSGDVARIRCPTLITRWRRLPGTLAGPKVGPQAGAAWSREWPPPRGGRKTPFRGVPAGGGTACHQGLEERWQPRSWILALDWRSGLGLGSGHWMQVRLGATWSDGGVPTYQPTSVPRSFESCVYFSIVAHADATKTVTTLKGAWCLRPIWH